MGGAVSAGRDNNDLIDNLIESHLIKTDLVERVFRAVDRAHYLLPESRESAYKDLAWRCGMIHLSAPCIYSEVMEGLELKEGLSFLNLGSGTGYLSTMVGLVLGQYGVNHGIELHPSIIKYANEHLHQFIEKSKAVDEFDFCEPKFLAGNCLSLFPTCRLYDRVYCGAACPKEYENYLKELITIGGILVMPYNDTLLQIKRTSETQWVARNLLSVSFASLIVPKEEESNQRVQLLDITPPLLQELCRSKIRSHLREKIYEENSTLRNPPPRSKSRGTKRNKITKVYNIPFGRDGDDDDLNVFHDLDPMSGSREMNALLGLVLSMGQNREAGALRFDTRSNDGLDDDDERGFVMEVDSSDYGRSDDSLAEDDNDPASDDEARPSCSREKPKTEPAANSSAQATSSSAPDSGEEKEKKREKFDSGIGEDMASSLAKCESDDSDDASDNGRGHRVASILKWSQTDTTLEVEEIPLPQPEGSTKSDSRRKSDSHRKRQHSSSSTTSSLCINSSEEEQSESESGNDTPPRTVHRKRTKHPCNIRRRQISKQMKEKTLDLPLPQMLKVYVNMGRLF